MLALSLTPKNIDRWIGGYAKSLAERYLRPRHEGPRHVLFALCDHFEPLWGGASGEKGRERVSRWEREYPALANEFRDADGRPPRHTFFFPGEQYAPSFLDSLGRLAGRGFGEVELHLHHDADDAERLGHGIRSYLRSYGEHGHLSRTPDGRIRYGFIHGNWCLANSRRDGRHCGVDSELDVLFETGCYADFTFPSAPDETQPGIVNRIYWPVGDLSRARAHERGVPARVGQARSDRILIIQGPLSLARREGRLGVRIESSALTSNDPATPARVATWIAQGIHIEGRPDWIFVKVHTHGAPELQAESLLGEQGRRLHRALREYNDGRDFVLHYVTAREMFNIAVAAMHGLGGNPDAHRDYALPKPPVAP